MWVVEKLGTLDMTSFIVPKSYICVKPEVPVANVIDVGLWNTQTGERRSLRLYSRAIVEQLQDYKPYGMFSGQDMQFLGEDSVALVSIGREDLQFLEYVDIVETTNSTVEPVVLEFKNNLHLLFGAPDYLAVDEERSVYCSNPDKHSVQVFNTLYKIAIDKSGVWAGDYLYILKSVVNNVFFAYKVSFKDIRGAKRMVTKVKVLRG